VIERGPRRSLRAVDEVSFEVVGGETLALVGESGCGKSTVARLIVGLYGPTSGRVEFRGRRLQMIFQDPYASLNPRWRVRDIVAEPIRFLNLEKTPQFVKSRVEKHLVEVGLSADDGEKYPHEFSGGQRQRISIARALAGEPDLLICDEPTSALDVSVQAQILNLMADLQKRLGLTYLFISHNLAGEVPNPLAPPSGCAFNPRCPHANERCRLERPQLLNNVACHAFAEGRI